MEQQDIAVLQSLLDHIVSEKELVADEVRVEIDRYWDWFKDSNKRIAEELKVGLTKNSTSSIAPTLEKKTSRSTGPYKYYIVWKSYSKTFRKRMSMAARPKGASLPLHSYKLMDVSHILEKRTTWDKSEALLLEKRLHRFRILLRTLQESEMKVRVGLRQLRKLENQEKSNG